MLGFMKRLAEIKQRREKAESQREELFARLLKRADRVKVLEKDVERLGKAVREAQTDMNRVAMKIMKVEVQLKKLSKNRASKKGESDG